MKKSTKILIVFFGALLLIHICAVICIPTISFDGSYTADDKDSIVQYKYFFEKEMSGDNPDSIVVTQKYELELDE